MTLTFVGCHSEAQSQRKLLPLHLNRQRPVLWLKLDPWNHDVVSCNKSNMKHHKTYNLLAIHTFVRTDGYLGMDDPRLQLSNDIPRAVDMAPRWIQVADQHHWSPNFQLQEVRGSSIHIDRVEVLLWELV